MYILKQGQIFLGCLQQQLCAGNLFGCCATGCCRAAARHAPGGQRECHLQSDARCRPPRHVLAHHLRGLQDAAGVGDVAVGEAVAGEVGLAAAGGVEIDRLDIADVVHPVGVVEEVLVAVGGDENLEALGHAGSALYLRLAHGLQFLHRRLAEDVVARDDVLRAKALPVVGAFLHVVEQAQLLQVLAALEGTVLYDHLQVAVRVVAAARALVELDGLHVLVAGDGVAA